MAASQVLSQGLVEPSQSWFTIYPKYIIRYGIGNFYIPKFIGPNNTVSPWVWVVGGAVAGGIISSILIAIDIRSQNALAKQQALEQARAMQEFHRTAAIQYGHLYENEAAWMEQQQIIMAFEEHRARALERARGLENIRVLAEQQARISAEQRALEVEHRRRALADHWARALAEQSARDLEEQRAGALVEEWTTAQQQARDQAIVAARERERTLEQQRTRDLETQRRRESEVQQARAFVQIIQQQVEINRAEETQRENAIQNFRQRPICQEECIICFDPLQAPVGTAQLTIDMLVCGHTFHNACIGIWFQNSHECPVCRNNNASQNIQNVTDRCRRTSKRRRRRNRRQNCV